MGRRTTPEKAKQTEGSRAPDRDDEARLVRLAKAGDPVARERLVLLYQTMVYNLALRITRDPEEAAVALQETFLKVLGGLDGFRASSRLSSWIYRIATNEAIQRLRHGKRGGGYVDIAEIHDLEADPKADLSALASRLSDPHVLLENRELRRHLEEAVGMLPPKHRVAFVLVDVEGLSLRNAARAAGGTVAALKTDLHRARLFLRDRLGAYLEGDGRRPGGEGGGDDR